MLLSISFRSSTLIAGFKPDTKKVNSLSDPYCLLDPEELDPRIKLLELITGWNESSNPPVVDASPLLSIVKNKFDAMKAKGDKIFLAFGNDWMEVLHFISLPHNQNAQNFVENYLEQNPTKSLLMAFDLEETFQMQFPQHLYQSISRWDALYMQPAINERIMPYRTIAGRPQPHIKPL